jgi:hypothetical protein
VGRYFGREPRFSREEIEAQAKQAIEERVGMGRPPAEEWAQLDARMAAMDRESALQPQPEPVVEPQPAPTTVGAQTPTG